MLPSSGNSSAFSTKEGLVIGMSNELQSYPELKTPAHECVVEVQLNGRRRVVQELLEKTDGVFQRPFEVGIRSALAQGGLEAGHPDCTHIHVGKTTAHITTLLTEVSGNLDTGISRAVHRVARDGRLQLLNLMVLPEEAKRGVERRPFMKDRSYEIRWDKIHPGLLYAALIGQASARELLDDPHITRGIPDPKLLQPGTLYLGQVWNPRQNGYLGVIRRTIETGGGRETDARHLAATRLDPGRSDGIPRHIELILPIGSPPLALKNLEVVIERFAIETDPHEETRRWA